MSVFAPTREYRRHGTFIILLLPLLLPHSAAYSPYYPGMVALASLADGDEAEGQGVDAGFWCVEWPRIDGNGLGSV